MAQTHRAVWWRCVERGHERRASIHGLSTGGCPYCAHKSAAREDSLAAVLPKLARHAPGEQITRLLGGGVISRAFFTPWLFA
jgi:hypothetical protein